MFNRFRSRTASACNDQGNKHREQGNWQAAIASYEKAVALDPKWSSPQYNLGLVYKYRKQWPQSIEHNRRAVQLDPNDEAAWWNLGIAATAVGDWATARTAWRGFGIDMPEGSEPIIFPSGMTPIRLNPDGDHTEVVWAERLCPARARIASIPLATSNHRWQDVVLHDGAPVGYRKSGGRDVPVFNELVRLEESVYGTYLAEVRLPEDAGDGVLERVAENWPKRIGVEDWTTSIHMLCKACSEGRPHKTHDEQVVPSPGVRRMAIAAQKSEDAREIIEAWKREHPGIEIRTVEELVKPVGHVS